MSDCRDSYSVCVHTIVTASYGTVQDRWAGTGVFSHLRSDRLGNFHTQELYSELFVRPHHCLISRFRFLVSEGTVDAVLTHTPR